METVKKADKNTDVNNLNIDKKYHDVVAAKCASKLRLAMRTVGYQLIHDDKTNTDDKGRPLLPTYQGGKLKAAYNVQDAAEYLEKYLELSKWASALSEVNAGNRDNFRLKLHDPVEHKIEKYRSAKPDATNPFLDFGNKHGEIATFQNMLDCLRLGIENGYPISRAIGKSFQQARYLTQSRRRDGDPAYAHIIDVVGLLIDHGVKDSDTLTNDRFERPVHYFLLPHKGKDQKLLALLREEGFADLSAFADIIARGAGHTTTEATKALLAEYGYTPKF